MGNPSHLERALLPHGFHRAAQATPESGENLFEMILAKTNIFLRTSPFTQQIWICLTSGEGFNQFNFNCHLFYTEFAKQFIDYHQI